jgi:hypothetical protein
MTADESYTMFKGGICQSRKDADTGIMVRRHGFRTDVCSNNNTRSAEKNA